MKALFKDNILIGLIWGLVVTAFGFFAFGFFWSLAKGISLDQFIHQIFLGSDIYQSNIITISALPNVILFYVMMRSERYRFCSGLLLVLIATVIGAVIYY